MIAAACGVEVLSMLVVSTYPSLIPILQDSWAMTSAQAGTINGLFFAGMFVSVALFAPLTDRLSPKPLYLGCLALGSAAALAFAAMADGFLSAALFRLLEGVALGGTYMPGLRILTDNVPERSRSRATSFYTASYYLAAGLSYFIALALEPAVGWRWTVAVCGLGPATALACAAFLIPAPPRNQAPPPKLLDLGPVLANRRAVGFSLIYAIHNAEMAAFASWLVPFLVFSRSLQPAESAGMTLELASLAALVTIVALPASVGGNEIAHKVSRQIWIVIVALLSAATAIGFGVSAASATWIVVLLAFVYSATIAFDSSAITGGLLLCAEPSRKGMTMAFYSVVGFIGATAGPSLFGLALDLSGGGGSHRAWITAFVCIAGLVLIQPLLVARLLRRPLMYE